MALARGFWHAHMGWLLERVSTNTERFAPHLLADRDIRIVDRLARVTATTGHTDAQHEGMRP